jgi:Zn-dependent peptidase ImmA (M78 family)/DNA-binding XRE family transcriptional regulator
MLSGDRIRIARQRRRLSATRLAELADVTAVTISKIENGHQSEEEIVAKLAAALQYPIKFFYMDPLESLPADIVSFRSLKKMSAAERDAALAAGSLGIALYEWIDKRFNLPDPNLIDLSKERNRPEVAARLLRQHWELGDRPIGNVAKLLESKGIRLLSLSEQTANVDAYSFWKGDRPYVFLNQAKSAERSIFDSAHELAHLVLHHHAGARGEKGSEMQADAFASAFLMPEADVKNQIARVYAPSQIIQAKRRWRVSAMALSYRLHSLGLLSDWNYRSICIDLGNMGYRREEPSGVERETSTVLAKVLSALWTKRLTKSTIADDLGVPLEEVEALIFGLTGVASVRPGSGRPLLVHSAPPFDVDDE